MSELSLIKFSPKSFLHVLNEYNFPDWYIFLLFCFARNPGEPRDRTGNLLNPFKIDSKYKITIPNDLSGGTNIIQYMEDRASEIETIANGKYLDLFLSGGFDSVAVYATLIKICDVSKIRACFWYSDDTSDKKALNQFNPELYNYIISNKYNYRLLNNSQLHADDAVSIIGHPGNFISGTNVKNYVSKTRINGIITTLHSKIINGDYDNSNYTFTAPVTGTYLLAAQARLHALVSSYEYYMCFIATSNRNCEVFIHQMPDSLAYYGVGTAVVTDMDAADTATLKFFISSTGSGNTNTDVGTPTKLSGYLIG